jgi:hypothetical protein
VFLIKGRIKNSFEIIAAIITPIAVTTDFNLLFLIFCEIKLPKPFPRRKENNKIENDFAGFCRLKDKTWNKYAWKSR